MVGIGIIIATSTSKIRNMTATKKKCIENGRRVSLLGSYPHSNGDDISQFSLDFLDRISLTIRRAVGIIKARHNGPTINFPSWVLLIGS
jgi:hypothetical protein